MPNFHIIPLKYILYFNLKREKHILKELCHEKCLGSTITEFQFSEPLTCNKETDKDFWCLSDFSYLCACFMSETGKVGTSSWHKSQKTSIFSDDCPMVFLWQVYFKATKGKMREVDIFPRFFFLKHNKGISTQYALFMTSNLLSTATAYLNTGVIGSIGSMHNTVPLHFSSTKPENHEKYIWKKKKILSLNNRSLQLFFVHNVHHLKKHNYQPWKLTPYNTSLSLTGVIIIKPYTVVSQYFLDSRCNIYLKVLKIMRPSMELTV